MHKRKYSGRAIVKNSPVVDILCGYIQQ